MKKKGARRLWPHGERGEQWRITRMFAREQGMRVVPLEKGKGTRRKSWWEKAFEPSAMSDATFDGKNVGLATGYGEIVDVDFDDDIPQSRKLAELMFRKKTASFGRGGLRTHRLYRCNGALKTVKFQHPEYGSLIEFRGVGAQTMAPGSIHPDTDELITWFEHDGVLRMSSASLRRRCAFYAAGCVLLRHWNEGQRHDLAAALIGALVRHTPWTDRKIDNYVDNLACAAGDPENRKKAEYERDRYKNDEPTYGRKNLKALLGSDYAKVAQWLDLDGAPETDTSDDVLLNLGETAADYALRDIPPETAAIENFLAEKKIALFHGKSHAGKSFIVMFLVAALGAGKSFVNWLVTRAYKVLYIEAEMDETEFHSRVKSILPDSRNVMIIRPYQWEQAFGAPGPYIDNEADQARLLRYMELHDIKVFVAEPLSWLLRDADEMSNDDTKLYVPWLKSLKNLGITVITAHNEGWLGSHPRGASRVMDSVDLTFAVKGMGRGVYKLTRGKPRTSIPMKPKEVVLEHIMNSDGRLVLRRRHSKESRQKALLSAIHENSRVTASAMAETLGVDRKTITRDLNTLSRLGHLSTENGNRVVTVKGLRWMESEQEM